MRRQHINILRRISLLPSDVEYTGCTSYPPPFNRPVAFTCTRNNFPAGRSHTIKSHFSLSPQGTANPNPSPCAFAKNAACDNSPILFGFVPSRSHHPSSACANIQSTYPSSGSRSSSSPIASPQPKPSDYRPRRKNTVTSNHPSCGKPPRRNDRIRPFALDFGRVERAPPPAAFDFSLYPQTRRHPERSRSSGGARDLPRINPWG